MADKSGSSLGPNAGVESVEVEATDPSPTPQPLEGAWKSLSADTADGRGGSDGPKSQAGFQSKHSISSLGHPSSAPRCSPGLCRGAWSWHLPLENSGLEREDHMERLLLAAGVAWRGECSTSLLHYQAPHYSTSFECSPGSPRRLPHVPWPLGIGGGQASLFQPLGECPPRCACKCQSGLVTAVRAD